MASLTTPAIIGPIEKALASFPVTLAYLFGSHALGQADEESDVDVAVLVAPSVPAADRPALRVRLMRAIAESLRVPLDKVDVVVLQDVPALLQYNVVRGGRLLLAADRADRIAYEARVESRYEDEAPLLEREAALTVDRILTRPA